jgi:two-component system, OmpR family, response regulator
MRLLLVEDDVKLVRALERGLEQEGYAVDAAVTGEAALERATAREYDAVLLDVMLPGIDGFAVCEELRRTDRHIPILMLTARSEVPYRIRGLDAGADDYLVKPFDFGELLARLRALVRRGSTVVEVGDLRVEPLTRVVTRAGATIELSPREFAVLEFLAQRAGTPVSRAELLAQVWADAAPGSDNVVDVYVGYLRRKLERPGTAPLIRTVRGVGFVLEAAA